MHWIIQHDEHWDKGTQELIRLLDHGRLPYTIVRVRPFVGDIQPDVDPQGRVIVIGSYSMRHTAKAKGWVPGSFDLGHLSYADHIAVWGEHMLNHDAAFAPFKYAKPLVSRDDNNPSFIRPSVDSKFFAGKLYTYGEFSDWWEKVVVLQEDDGTSLTGDTVVMVASPKNIQAEFRTWIIDGRLVTASLYKRGDWVHYDSNVDQDVLDFAQARADEWSPLKAFVLDVARTTAGLKIVETNTINAAGFYAGDVAKIVSALESIDYEKGAA